MGTETQIDKLHGSDADDEARTQRAREEMARAKPTATSGSLVVLATLGVFYTLYLSAEILLPFVFAIVLNLLLQPPKRFLQNRLRLPATLTALILLLALMLLVGVIGAAVSVPAASWIAKVPQSLPKLQEHLGFLRGPIDAVRHGMEQIQQATSSQSGSDGGASAQGAAQAQPQPSQGGSGLGGVGLTVLRGTRFAFGEMLTFVVTLFFLLAAGDSLLRRLVEILPTFADKRQVVEVADEVEANVSGYLATITIMNVLVGVANGLAMWALGMPDPLLWGTLAFLLNYVPILGPLTGVAVFFLVGMFSSPSLLWALLPPAIYLLVHVLEGETVTPMLLAQRFTLNPVLVIMSLFFWDWMWGVPGAFLAVPLLAVAKIVCDRVPPLMPIGHILGAQPKERPGKDKAKDKVADKAVAKPAPNPAG